MFKKCKNGQAKKEREINQVWENISTQDSGSNKNQDEIYFTKLLARDCVQLENLYSQAERNSKVTRILAGIFGCLGAVLGPIIIWMTRTITETSIPSMTAKQIQVDMNCIYVSVLGMILLEIIAGLCIWVNYSARRQMEHYYDALCDNERFLLSLGIAAKLENSDPSLKGEIYKRILESEIRRRENRA